MRKIRWILVEDERPPGGDDDEEEAAVARVEVSKSRRSTVDSRTSWPQMNEQI